MVVNNPSTSYTVLLMLAFMAGVGGGVFSGFMPSTSYFFPKSKGHRTGPAGRYRQLRREPGAVRQPVGRRDRTVRHLAQAVRTVAGVRQPGQEGIQAQVWANHAGWFWVPWVIIGVILAFTLLKSVPVQARGVKEQLDIFGNKHTWLMTWLYILTFGTFSGLAAQFGPVDEEPLQHAVRPDGSTRWPMPSWVPWSDQLPASWPDPSPTSSAVPK